MWHYLNDSLEQCTCSQEQAEESSETCFSGIRASVPSRSKTTPEKSCSPDSATESSRASQSGTTSPPLTANHGVEKSMLSAVDFLARTSPLQGKEPVWPVLAPVFGLRWPELYAKWDRASSLWKTHPCLFLAASMSCSVTLPRWGMMQSGELSVLPTPVGYTPAEDCGSWPTPQKVDYKGTSRGSTFGQRAAQYKKWGGGELRLSAIYPNPLAYEVLMMWPTGWTALKPLATDKFRQWLRSHGGCCTDDEAKVRTQ